jgi:hypothetical protein
MCFDTLWHFNAILILAKIKLLSYFYICVEVGDIDKHTGLQHYCKNTEVKKLK